MATKQQSCDVELCKVLFKGHIVMRVEFLDPLLGCILVVRVLMCSNSAEHVF
jgi:hypothetical protein